MDQPLVSIVIPHWQVQELMTLCLRSIRRHTRDLPYEVIVVDNGSKDASLDWLRSLKWIRLIERGEQTPQEWIVAMATALDIGIAEGRGKYLLIMHSDVIVKRDGWLKLLVDAIESGDDKTAAAGTGKLETKSKLSLLLKKWTDTKRFKLWLRRTFLGDQKAVWIERPVAPRDFCALYRLDVLREHKLSFIQRGELSAGDSMYLNLVERGYNAKMIPVPTMMSYIDHIAHATAAVRPEERRLKHSRTQRKTERKIEDLFSREDVKSLLADVALDQ